MKKMILFIFAISFSFNYIFADPPNTLVGKYNPRTGDIEIVFVDSATAEMLSKRNERLRLLTPARDKAKDQKSKSDELAAAGDQHYVELYSFRKKIIFGQV